jgi:hypothetical protein
MDVISDLRFLTVENTAFPKLPPSTTFTFPHLTSLSLHSTFFAKASDAEALLAGKTLPKLKFLNATSVDYNARPALAKFLLSAQLEAVQLDLLAISSTSAQ